MNNSHKLLHFALDSQRHASFLYSVGKVYRTVKVTLLPNAPPIVSGIINVQGRIIPFVDVRKRFELPEREIGPNDPLIVAKTPKLHVVLVANRIKGVIGIDDLEIIKAGRVLPNAYGKE